MFNIVTDKKLGSPLLCGPDYFNPILDWIKRLKMKNKKLAGHNSFEAPKDMSLVRYVANSERVFLRQRYRNVFIMRQTDLTI